MQREIDCPGAEQQKKMSGRGGRWLAGQDARARNRREISRERKEKKSVGSVKLISSDSLLKELYKHFLPFDSSSSSCLEIYVFVYQKNTQQQQQLEREQEE